MEDADDLYALAPEDFVAARNALVKRLKADGRKDEAGAVSGLRRPSVAAWALNRVARDEAALVEAAIAAGQRLRTASEEAMAGDAASLRSATGAEREAANAVVRAAGSHLGARVDAQRSALLATIRVAALDEAVADQLRRGVLVSEQDQPGFGFGLEAEAGPAAEAAEAAEEPIARSKAKATKPTTKRTELEEQAEKAEKAAARAEEKARRQEEGARRRTAERLAKEATRLTKVAAAAEAEADTARAAATDAEAKAAAAQQALDELRP